MTDKEEKYVGSVSQQECEIAETALLEFNRGNYNNCLQEINKLENRTFDFKVSHNKIVAEYYKSELKKTEAFQKNLNYLLNQFSIRLEKLDDVDHCVAHFNLAVVYFHNNQYTQTLRIMERVYKFIEPMDETLAKQVGLLLVELQLSVKQIDKAMTLLVYLENYFTNTSVTELKGGKNVGKEQSDKKSTTPVEESFKKKLAVYKARCYLMNHNLESFKKEVAVLQNSKVSYCMFQISNVTFK
ncbi:CCR4-NOT transcription complex subunit 10-like [Agrilus planipennis]|uniref:CCR4-NOT transcription complex subunit 10 n=1 Tax=Agrilus planipennis TaxID=224129 RepID=A0A7F5RBZ3_AGRPL|nr:CCR4-NOT transcription complex subunit 10-like [Agrilus planipennis]